jgi:hypothetical protein
MLKTAKANGPGQIFIYLSHQIMKGRELTQDNPKIHDAWLP